MEGGEVVEEQRLAVSYQLCINVVSIILKLSLPLAGSPVIKKIPDKPEWQPFEV